jgi:hypothetical protein
LCDLHPRPEGRGFTSQEDKNDNYFDKIFELKKKPDSYFNDILNNIEKQILKFTLSDNLVTKDITNKSKL